MKTLLLTVAITLGLAVTASADKKYHGHGHHGHSSHGHSSHSYHGHSSYGHSSYGYVTKKVWVPGYTTRVWVPPRYDYVRQPCGRVVRVCVCNGYYDTRHVPGYYTYKKVRSSYSRPRCNNGITINWRF